MNKRFKHVVRLVMTAVMCATPLLGLTAPAPAQASSSTAVTLDTMDSLAGWSSSNPLALDTVNKQEGAASLSMTGSQVVQFQKSFASPVDSQLTMQYGTLNFWYYVDDVTKLDGTYGQVEITSSGGPDVNEVAWDFVSRVKPQLSNGWNLVTLRLDDTSIVLGNPDFKAINFFRIFSSIPNPQLSN